MQKCSTRLSFAGEAYFDLDWSAGETGGLISSRRENTSSCPIECAPALAIETVLILMKVLWSQKCSTSLSFAGEAHFDLDWSAGETDGLAFGPFVWGDAGVAPVQIEIDLGIEGASGGSMCASSGITYN